VINPVAPKFKKIAHQKEVVPNCRLLWGRFPDQFKVRVDLSPKCVGVSTGTHGHVSPEVHFNTRCFEADLRRASNQMITITDKADVWSYEFHL
jgi:hypothetical protein